MKTIRSVLAGIFAVFALGACGGPAETSVIMEATILRAEGDVILLAPNEEDGSVTTTAHVCSTSVADIPLTGEDGSAIAAEDLAPGQIVSLEYDGYIRESYPGGITCSRLAVTGRQPDSWENPIDADEFFNPAPDPSDPYAGLPTLGIETRTAETVGYTAASYGSASWSENGRSTVVDSALPSSGEARERLAAVERQAGTEAPLRLAFSRNPAEFTLDCWEWGAFAAEGTEAAPADCSLDGLEFTFPGQEGKYLCRVTAGWPEGDVTYFFALDASPFSLTLEEEIPLEDGEAGYTLFNRTGEELSALFIPTLEKQTGDGWEILPLNAGFCGVRDPFPAVHRGTVSLDWWENLEPGRYRLSFSVQWEGEDYRPSCTFSLT